MRRIENVLAVLSLIVFAYTIGLGMGYVAGYSDRYAREVVEYRMTHHVRGR